MFIFNYTNNASGNHVVNNWSKCLIIADMYNKDLVQNSWILIGK
jgi:hypothetical protein